MALKQFNVNEDVVTTEITVTDGFFDGGKGIVAGTSLTTSSLSTDQKKYYYNLNCDFRFFQVLFRKYLNLNQ